MSGEERRLEAPASLPKDVKARVDGTDKRLETIDNRLAGPKREQAKMRMGQSETKAPAQGSLLISAILPAKRR